MPHNRQPAVILAALALVVAACGGTATNGTTSTVFDTTASSTASPTPPSDTPGATLPPPNPVNASVTLAEEDAVTATIGIDGGTIETVGSDGYRYVLTVPPGALSTDVTVTITPIADLTSEVVDQFVAGVQMAPEGLIFGRPASLRIDGAPVAGAMALYYRGDGEDVSFMPFLDSGGTSTILVYHFSGAGIAAPSPSAATRSPGSRQARIMRVAFDEFLEEGGEQGGCVSKGGKAWKTITEEQQRSFQEEIIPALIRARNNDEVLWDATSALVDWLLANMSIEEYGLLCDPEAWSDDLAPPAVPAETLTNQGVDLEELDLEAGPEVDGFTLARKLLAAGLEYAIGNAGRLCAETHDLGELKYVVGWAAVAVWSGVLIQSGDSAEWAARWQRLMASEVSSCMRFEFQFDSYIELWDDPILFTATMRATVADIVPGVNLELVGEEVGINWGSAPMTYAPQLEYRGEQGQCNVHVRDYSAADLQVMVPLITPPKPKRTIELPLIEGSTGDEEDRITLFMQRLDGSEWFDLGCWDMSGPNPDGAWGPWAFNNLHEDALSGVPGDDGGPTFVFPLEPGPGKLIGRLTFQRSLNMEGTEVYEETTMNLFHTPASQDR